MTDEELIRRLQSNDVTVGDAKYAARRIAALLETNRQLVGDIREATTEVSRMHIRVHMVEVAYAEWSAKVNGLLNAQHH